MSRTGLLSAVVVSLAFQGCGPKSGNTVAKRDLSQFECNERRISYMVAGGFAAEEAGVTVECGDKDPRLTKWTSEGGDRAESVHRLGGEQFDALWKTVDSSGWRHVAQDCKNPNAKDGDPVYMIEVADHALSVTLSCDGISLPFPYDRIVNELDLRSAGFGDRDEPGN